MPGLFLTFSSFGISAISGPSGRAVDRVAQLDEPGAELVLHGAHPGPRPRRIRVDLGAPVRVQVNAQVQPDPGSCRGSGRGEAMNPFLGGVVLVAGGGHGCPFFGCSGSRRTTSG